MFTLIFWTFYLAKNLKNKMHHGSHENIKQQNGFQYW